MIVLPPEDYADISALLFEDSLELIRLLSTFHKDKGELARDLVNIYVGKGRIEHLLTALIHQEIIGTDSYEILFRSNSVTTKAIDHFLKTVGTHFLRSTVGPVLEIILKQTQNHSIEVSRRYKPKLTLAGP